MTESDRRGNLFVSFWSVGLDNLPEGTFAHRRLSADEAKQLLEAARGAGTLACVSQRDLLAPHHERDRDNHERLSRALGDHHGVALSLEDFMLDEEVDGDDAWTIRPLAFAQIGGSDRLMVVSCHYVMTSGRDGPEFEIEPGSVTFHLFEAVAGA